jgi:hypothetical protein
MDGRNCHSLCITAEPTDLQERPSIQVMGYRERKKTMRVRETICRECPFRQTATQGWLGTNEPKEFARAALSDHSVPCHMTINYDETDGDKLFEQMVRSPRCRGAVIMMRNERKLPRDPAAAAAVKDIQEDTKTVFSNRLQFIDYHEGAEVKSWELPEAKNRRSEKPL